MLSDHLRQMRLQREMTQAEVARKAGISVLAYRNLEAGRSEPKPQTLRSLATAMGVPLRELLAPTPSLRAVRFRAQKAMKRRGQVIADVSRWLRNFNELEEMLGQRRRYSFSKLAGELGSQSVGKDRAIQAAQRARVVLGLREKEPIHDICGLLESSGIKVYPLALESDGFFGLSVAPQDGGPAIVVNVWSRISVERWIFSAAHELGHLLLHLESYDVEQTDEDKRQEEEANRFASHFLMPELGFRNEWDETYGLPFIERVLKVKRIYRVSYQTVLFRLIESGDYTSDLWRKFHTHYRRLFGKALLKMDEPLALAASSFNANIPEAKKAHELSELDEADFVEDRLLRLVRQGIESEKITLSRGAEILETKLPRMRELAAMWEA